MQFHSFSVPRPSDHLAVDDALAAITLILACCSSMDAQVPSLLAVALSSPPTNGCTIQHPIFLGLSSRDPLAIFLLLSLSNTKSFSAYFCSDLHSRCFRRSFQIPW